mmetsp:Transcript_64897/g.130466  ORF Transcript_64897/g.130466 Transcript_64897/m.130466 type:complete len:86 (-) Transcript_64897:485-742(-)
MFPTSSFKETPLQWFLIIPLQDSTRLQIACRHPKAAAARSNKALRWLLRTGMSGRVFSKQGHKRRYNHGTTRPLKKAQTKENKQK